MPLAFNEQLISYFLIHIKVLDGYQPVFGQPPLFLQFLAMNYPYEGYNFHHQGPSYMAPPPAYEVQPCYHHHSAKQRGRSDRSSYKDTVTDINKKKIAREEIAIQTYTIVVIYD